MAAKRRRDVSEDGDDDELPDGKQIRAPPSFPEVVREVLSAKALEKILSTIEPTLRQMVRKGVEEGVQQSLLQVPRSLQCSPRIQIQPTEPAFELVFSAPPSLPIFSGSKIEGEDGNPLQLFIVSGPSGGSRPSILPASIKVEVVAVYGDFPPEGREDWTGDEFERSIVKERAGKRPLIAGGSTSVTLRNGAAPVDDIVFTDNSSWVKCRKFRIGARVAPGACEGLRIKEALTKAFMVKDHRGESYMKHHPPYLTDEVWRLKKISKDGKFHDRLSKAGINTVQDFLRLSAVDPHELKEILGKGMSDRMWETTISHARECVVVPTSERYLYRNSRYTVVLDPTCRALEIIVDGVSYNPHSLQMEFVEQMVREAYEQWNSLELVDETPAATTTFALQGATTGSSAIVPAHNPEPAAMVMVNYYQSVGQHQNLIGDSYSSPAENAQIGPSVWAQSHAPPPAAATLQGHAYDSPPNLLLPSSQGFFVHGNYAAGRRLDV